jgi:hypothetical protein
MGNFAMLYRRLALLAGLTGAVPLATAATAQAPTQPPIRPVLTARPALDPAACTDPVRRASIIADSGRITAVSYPDAVVYSASLIA